MTNHDKFKALLDKLGLSTKDLATILGMSHGSVRNQLGKNKDLPRWAKSMLLVDLLTNENK